jgi:2-polyprenyl-6-methoxyphenol hydroxylase-like FAD-dependent oxidoreductase
VNSPLIHQTHSSFDVAIIGGGIAGSALAIVLSDMGMDVTIIERAPAFRDRVRGEEIHPWGVREVDELGLRPLVAEAGAVELPFWTTYRDRTPGDPYAWTTDVPASPPALSVGHPQLQEVLLRAAEAAGAHVFRPATATPVRMGDGWSLDVDMTSDRTTFHARLLIGADGRMSATRKMLDANVTRDAVHHTFGGMLVRGIDLHRDSAHQGYYDGGFAMVFPQQGDLARIYYVGPASLERDMLGPKNIPEFLRRVASCYPDGALEHAVSAGPLGFFPNADVPVDRVTDDGIALIGDAAGANDPTQGHGLSLVFRDVRTLRDRLAADPVTAMESYGAQRLAYYGILRAHASWAAPLLAGTGSTLEALREQVRRARESDPSAEGFGNLLATGPTNQRTDDATRSRFFGEHLPDATIHVEGDPGSGGLHLTERHG